MKLMQSDEEIPNAGFKFLTWRFTYEPFFRIASRLVIVPPFHFFNLYKKSLLYHN